MSDDVLQAAIRRFETATGRRPDLLHCDEDVNALFALAAPEEREEMHLLLVEWALSDMVGLGDVETRTDEEGNVLYRLTEDGYERWALRKEAEWHRARLEEIHRQLRTAEPRSGGT
jgi:hypothetical protein